MTPALRHVPAAPAAALGHALKALRRPRATNFIIGRTENPRSVGVVYEDAGQHHDTALGRTLLQPWFDHVADLFSRFELHCISATLTAAPHTLEGEALGAGSAEVRRAFEAAEARMLRFALEIGVDRPVDAVFQPLDLKGGLKIDPRPIAAGAPLIPEDALDAVPAAFRASLGAWLAGTGELIFYLQLPALTAHARAELFRHIDVSGAHAAS